MKGNGINVRKVIVQNAGSNPEQTIVKMVSTIKDKIWGWLIADDLHGVFWCRNGRTPSRPPCLQTPSCPPTQSYCQPSRPPTGAHGLREDSRQARRSSEKDGAEPGARWKGGAAYTSSRASAALLGNRVLCRVSSLGLLEGGLQFPSVLGSLCAARLRSLAANAAIKACFAPGLMLGSVVEWPVRPPWSRGTGR